MAQAVPALPTPLPDPVAVRDLHRWVVAANDDLSPDRRPRSTARFTLIDQAAEASDPSPKPKSFRFSVDSTGGHWEDGALSPFQAAGRTEARADEKAARSTFSFDPFDSYSIGDPSRNAPPFLASLIAQSRLGDGLAHSRHGAASEAYRLSGAQPPMPDGRPRLMSFVV